MKVKQLEFQTQEDYDRAAREYGRILRERNYVPSLTPMFVQPEDEEKLLSALSEQDIPYREVQEESLSES